MTNETQDSRDFRRFMPPFDLPKFKRRALRTYHRTVPTLFWIALLTFLTLVLAVVFTSPASSQEPGTASEPIQAMNEAPSPAKDRTEAPKDPCGLTDVVCEGEKVSRVITGTVTTYQAVAAQTDATPCVGAMPGVNFCEPPFPIVANNCLKLGSKVAIRGMTYTVADRMNKRYGCDYFDVLTSGENYTLKNEPINVL